MEKLIWKIENQNSNGRYRMYKRGIKMKRRKLKSFWLRYAVFICFCLLLIYCGRRQASEIDTDYTIKPTVSITSENPTQIDHVELFEVNQKIKTEFTPVFDLSEEERWATCCMVAGESKGEPYEGQWAVAQCIYQACVNGGLQPSEVRIEYKYSGWDEKLEFDNPELWAQIEEIVSRVFDYGEMYVEDEILWFYAPRWMKNGVSEWHESQRFVIEIGDHKFFGPWS